MKITIDIDCSLDEACDLMGLPDVSAMNEEMVAGLSEKLQTSLSGEDPGNLLKNWFSGWTDGIQNMQKKFWSQFTGGAGKGGSES